MSCIKTRGSTVSDYNAMTIDSSMIVIFSNAFFCIFGRAFKSAKASELVISYKIYSNEWHYRLNYFIASLISYEARVANCIMQLGRMRITFYTLVGVRYVDIFTMLRNL